MLEGDLWLDSATGDVYRATDPWTKDGTWHTWGTALWKVIDDVLMVQPADGDMGTLGMTPWVEDGWSSSVNPSVESITSVMSKGTIAMNANSGSLFQGYTSLTDISALSGWDISNVTSMDSMFADCPSLTDLSPISGWDTSGVAGLNTTFYGCASLTDISALSGWDVSNVTDMYQTFSDCTSLTDASALSGWDMSNVASVNFTFLNCPIERIGIPSLAHGGKNFVSNLVNAQVVANLNTTMLTNTTTHETMSANQMLTDMDANPSKYAAGTVWTL